MFAPSGGRCRQERADGVQIDQGACAILAGSAGERSAAQDGVTFLRAPSRQIAVQLAARLVPPLARRHAEARPERLVEMRQVVEAPVIGNIGDIDGPLIGIAQCGRASVEPFSRTQRPKVWPVCLNRQCKVLIDMPSRSAARCGDRSASCRCWRQNARIASICNSGCKRSGSAPSALASAIRLHRFSLSTDIAGSLSEEFRIGERHHVAPGQIGKRRDRHRAGDGCAA